MKITTVIKNAQIVKPLEKKIIAGEIGINGEKIVMVAKRIPKEHITAKTQILDAQGYLVFPGVVDAHTHTGIYAPLVQDALSESKAAATGGVTTMLNYFRTGQYYLNEGGSYSDFYPKVLKLSEGKYFVDYGYHLAPIQAKHIDEMEMLLKQYGMCSFKIFMFYGGYGLHGSTSQNSQRDFLMLDESDSYDIAHFEMIMRKAAELTKRYPKLADSISVSLHCELADILRAYTTMVQKENKLTGLKAYSAARPPHSEGLAIWIASYLANETNCPNINLLHLTSKKAVEAALTMEKVFPHVNFGKEVTIAHLLLDYDCEAACHAKVNPPIRSRQDVEYLWKQLLLGSIDWVVSDHACCAMEEKTAHGDHKDGANIWKSKSGFGGTEYLLSGLFSEGTKRGLSPNRVAALVSYNPAKRYGLTSKGDIAVGKDADLVFFNPKESFVVRGHASPSSAGYTPLEGIKLKGKVKTTMLRGKVIFNNDEVVGEPCGAYQFRPQKK
ncbi:MAG: dihydroorotase family protein [Methylacidiphilales bacterium]|nr:dihydroorotase family protein [Candidatus Methylacidiphilales bacterium]